MTSPAPNLSTSPLSTPPPSSAPLSTTTHHQTPPPPRPTIPIPFPLQNQITIYLEESLYPQALSLLTSLVTSSAHTPPLTPTYAPCPAHLALASTLVVHPALTTRSRKPEEWAQADAALRFLRVVQGVLGAGAGWTRALRFGERGRREREGQSSGEEGGWGEKVENRFANEGSLYLRAEDFWHVVGWGFNCAVGQPRRWGRWRVWIDWMVGVLRDEWRACVAAGKDQESLLWAYLGAAAGGYGGVRRVLRAVFANGNAKSRNEFAEVFVHELQEPKVEEAQPWKRREEEKLDVDRELYADYMPGDGEEDSDEAEARTTRRGRIGQYDLRRVSKRGSRESIGSVNSINNEEDPGEDGPAYFGGWDSLRLRLRVLQLLFEVALQMPREFMDVDPLLSHYVDFVRPLPLATFHAIVSPAAVPEMMSVDLQTALCEVLLVRTLLEGAAPAAEGRLLTQSKLEDCYLPYAATSSSAVDNAKVSLCVESLLRHLHAAGKLTARESLRTAIEAGLERRGAKTTEGRSKGGAAERRREAAWAHLLESGDRLSDIWRRLDEVT